MIRALFHFLILVLLPIKAIGQTNLIPNPGFELASQCPDNWSQLNRSFNWQVCKGSPDFFASCGSVDSFSVPQNLIGNQSAASGNAYCGLILYDKSNGGNDEIIGTQLTQSLAVGTKYFVSFKVVWKYNNPYSICCSQDKIGVLFSTVPYDLSNPPPQNNFAHVFSSSIISDTSSWTRVVGTIITDSSYSYFMLGNFFNNSNLLINNISPSDNSSYYFVDDICVSTDSMFAVNYSTGISTNFPTQNISIYPNPANEYFNIEVIGSNKPFDLRIYNSLGQLLYEQKNNPVMGTRIDICEMNESLLLIEIVSENQIIYYKLLK